MERVFCRRVASSNAIGMFVAVVEPPIVDPHLPSQVIYGAVHYAHWGWLLLFCIPVWMFTYIPLRNATGRRSRLIASVAALGVFGGIVSCLMPPQRPQMWVIGQSFMYTLLAFITVFLHDIRGEYQYLSDADVTAEGKSERLKATIGMWQQIFLGLSFGYLGTAFLWASVLNEETKHLVTTDHDLWILMSSNAVSLSIYSVMVILGPVNEAFQEVRAAIALLSDVRISKTSDAQA